MAYRQLYPDVAAQIAAGTVSSGFVHFITKGQAEGRVGIPGYGVGVAEPATLPRPAALLLGQMSTMRQVLWYFDEEFYLSVYRDAHALKRQGRVRSGLEHFLVAGCAEGRLPHPLLLPVLQDEPCDGWALLARMATRTPPAKRTIGMAAACAVRDLIETQPGAAEPAEITAALWRFLERPAVRSKLDAARYFSVNPDLIHALKGDAQAAQQHWETYGFFEGRPAPGTNFFSGRGRRAGAAPAWRHGVNFFGPLTAKSGLGDAARSYAAALRAAGIPVARHDISVMRHDAPPVDLFHDKALPYATNFFVLNPGQVIGFARRYGSDFLAGRFNIAAWVWALPAPLPIWRNALAAFDLIVTPSRFAADSFGLFTDLPIEVIPYAIAQAELRDAAAQGGLAQWGARLREEKDAGKRIVLFVMEDAADAARKGLDLYEKLAGHCHLAEPGRYVFVLKALGRDYSLTEASRAMGRHLLVIDGQIEFSELCYLKSLADVSISPHRGEGFGLDVFESLLLGVPALCSDFAGPAELLGADYPWLIPGGLTELGRETGPYRAGAVWFEPDFEVLLERFLALFGDTAARQPQPLIDRLAGALSPAAIGARLRGALEQHGGYLHGEEAAAPAAPQPKQEELYSFDTPDRNGQKLAGLAELVAQSGRPFFSVITPTFNSEPTWLWQLYEDLVAQSFPHWEWCVADDGSTRPETLRALRELRRRDARVQVSFGAAQAGLPAATNRAALTATGAYLVMVGQADRVSRELLKTYRTRIGARDVDDTAGVMIYCDEDKVDDAGLYGDPYFKPDRAPEHLMSCMYMRHCLCVRKQLFLELGGYRADYAGAEDHDFALRVAAGGTPIWHVDACLYHWRQAAGAATGGAAAGNAAEPGRLAVLDHCQRIGLTATVEHGMIPGTYRPRPALPRDTVCINIFTGCARLAAPPRHTYVERFVRSILQHRPAENFLLRIIVEFDRAGEIAHLESLSPDIEVVPYAWNTGTFNFAEKVNFAVQTEASERIVLLNDDMLATGDTWLEALLEMLEVPGVGVVGGRLLREDETLQHAGIVLGVGGASAHIFANAPSGEAGYNAFTQVIRNYAAVTGAMMAFRRSTFDLAGGFDESFPVDHNDVDFCLKVGEAGLRVVYTPFASLIHYESRSAKRLAPDELDTSRFMRRWESKIGRDPFYNVNLTRSGVLCEPRER